MPAGTPCAVLLRHGTTRSNRHGRFTSFTDVELEGGAHEELTRAAATLMGMSFDRVLTSPLLRARQTEEFLRAAGAFDRAPLEVCDDLRELDFGLFEGRTKRELRSGELSAAFGRWLRADAYPAAPRGEALAEAAVRAMRVLDRVAESGERVAIVSHGYLLKIMIAAAVPTESADGVRSVHLANGSVAILTRAGNRGWRLERR